MANTLYRVIYNGAEIAISSFTSYEINVEYSNDDVSQLYLKHTISIKGIVNPGLYTGVFTNADILNGLRDALTKPRQALQVVINGNVQIDTDGIDAKNGPIPRNVRIYDISGQTFYVEFTIDTWLACPDQSRYDQYPLRTSRWWQTHDIDQDLVTTITTEGYIIVRSDYWGFTPTQRNIDQFREHIAPVTVIQKGLNRIAQDYKLNEDGLRLDYRLVDQEYITDRSQYLFPVFNNGDKTKQPPNDPTKWDQAGPITSWQGNWKIEPAPAGTLGQVATGAVVVGTFSITATGSPVTPMYTIINFCVMMLSNRLVINKPGANFTIIRNFVFDESLDKNTFSMAVSWLITTKPVSDGSNGAFPPGLVTPIWQLGYPLPTLATNTKYTTQAPCRGDSIFWKLFGALPLDACANPNTSPDDFVPANPAPTYFGSSTSSSSPAPATQNSDLSDAQLTNPYIVSQVECQTHEESNTTQLPVATNDAAAPSFFVNFGQKYSKKVVRFNMSRLNAMPDPPQLSYAGWTLLQSTINQSEPEFLPSFVDRVYSINGEYIYGMVNTANIGNSNLYPTRSPVDSKTYSDAAYQPLTSSNFIDGLVKA